MRFVNEIVSFLLEIALLAVVGVVAWTQIEAVAPRVAALVGGEILLVAVWGILLAPRSPRRLGLSAGLVLSSLLLVLVPAGLFALGQSAAACAAAVVVLANRFLVAIWRQW